MLIYFPHYYGPVPLWAVVWGRGAGVSLALFKNWKKSVLIWRKKYPDLNFSFKVKFLRVSRRKNRRIFPYGVFLSRVVGVHQSVLIPRKLNGPKRFLDSKNILQKTKHNIKIVLKYNNIKTVLLWY